MWTTDCYIFSRDPCGIPKTKLLSYASVREDRLFRGCDVFVNFLCTCRWIAGEFMIGLAVIVRGKEGSEWTRSTTRNALDMALGARRIGEPFIAEFGVWKLAMNHYWSLSPVFALINEDPLKFHSPICKVQNQRFACTANILNSCEHLLAHCSSRSNSQKLKVQHKLTCKKTAIYAGGHWRSDDVDDIAAHGLTGDVAMVKSLTSYGDCLDGYPGDLVLMPISATRVTLGQTVQSLDISMVFLWKESQLNW